MTQQINLIDAALLASSDHLNGKLIAGVVGGLAVLVLGHFAFEQVMWHRVVAATPVPDAGSADGTVPADPLSASLEQLEAQLAASTRLQQSLNALMDSPKEPARRLQALVDAMPATMWLREVEFVGANNMRIAGSALRSEDLAIYSTRLGTQAPFTGLPIHLLKLDRREAVAEATPEPQAEASAPDAGGTSGTPGTPAPANPPPVVSYEFELSTLGASGSGATP